MKLTVSPAEDKNRLDHFLADQFGDVSRSFLQSLCKTDQVLVNGKPEKSGYRLRWGDTIELLYDMATTGVVPDISIPIIYEDSSVLVVNKPSGVLSHALSKFKNEPSVASFLRQRTGRRDAAGNNVRYGIVHRLDRLTSGVMVCAKNDEVMKHLQRQFSDRKVTKKYIAVTSGIPKHRSATINVPLERNPKAPATFRPGKNGKVAETSYKVLGTHAKRALVELKPKTGRTHQLRVHLSYINCPIVGDQLYGGDKADRLYLHASELSVQLIDGTLQTFRAPLPSEFNDRVGDNK